MVYPGREEGLPYRRQAQVPREDRGRQGRLRGGHQEAEDPSQGPRLRRGGEEGGGRCRAHRQDRRRPRRQGRGCPSRRRGPVSSVPHKLSAIHMGVGIILFVIFRIKVFIGWFCFVWSIMHFCVNSYYVSSRMPVGRCICPYASFDM